MLKKVLSSLTAAIAAFQISTAEAEKPWHSEDRFWVTTGSKVENPSMAFGLGYSEAMKTTLNFSNKKYTKTLLEYKLSLVFSKRFFLAGVDMDFGLVINPNKSKFEPLESIVKNYSIVLGVNGGANGYLFKNDLTRGASGGDAIAHIGPQIKFIGESNVNGKYRENKLVASLSAGPGLFMSGAPLLAISLRVEDEKRLTKMWGFGLAYEGTKIISKSPNEYSYHHTADAFVKVLSKKGRVLPAKFYFGLRHEMFIGEGMTNIALCLGGMEL